MQSPEQKNEAPASATTPKAGPILEPDYSTTPRPIRELAGLDDFPHCALGVHVDIQGFSGVVVEIVRDSIKVRPAEGVTQRFNANRLRTLYAPPIHIEPPSGTPQTEDRAKAVADLEEPKVGAEAPPRVYVENPDFALPMLPISEYASQPDFPRCVYGKHVDILGYTGVVIEIVKGSLKVQGPTGITRSYNAEVVRKLHGKSGPR